MRVKADLVSADVLVSHIMKTVDELRGRGLITSDMISDYEVASRKSLHSWLQFSMIEGARKTSLLGVPEMKIYFDSPLDPRLYGVEKKRRRHFMRVDVAFYDDDGDLIGLGECITQDGAHGCLATRDMPSVETLTTSDILRFAVEHIKPKPQFIILLIVLPERAKKIPWKTGIREIDEDLKMHRDYYRVFVNRWRNLANQLRKSVDVYMIVIKEDEILEVAKTC